MSVYSIETGGAPMCVKNDRAPAPGGDLSPWVYRVSVGGMGAVS